MRWNEFYKGKFRPRVFLGIILAHAYLIITILRYRPKRILEAGCGTATMSSFLSFFVKEIEAIDNDPQIVIQADNMKTRLKRQNVSIKQADLFDLPYPDNYFDIVFSQGVLEHFDDAEIREVVTEELRVGKLVVFSVPNPDYGQQDIGDERLLPKKQWETILSTWTLCKSKYYGRTWRKLFLGKPLHYVIVIASLRS